MVTGRGEGMAGAGRREESWEMKKEAQKGGLGWALNPSKRGATGHKGRKWGARGEGGRGTGWIRRVWRETGIG